jgi:transcriptional regulator with XRE-family HTH domain
MTKKSNYPARLDTLGDHIKKKRLDLGWTKKRMAAELGVDETTVYNWEIDRTVPVVRVVPGIIQFLGYVPYAPAKSLPEKLRTRRRRLGLSQKKLAHLLGVDESNLRGWESGRRLPSERFRLLLDDFCNEEMTPDYSRY